MHSIRINSNAIHLPPSIFRKYKGRNAQIIDTDEGVLIRPVNENISKARGVLKGSSFNTDSFLQQKALEKTLEL